MGTWENNVIHINNEFQNLWLALVFGYRANLFCMYYSKKKMPITLEKHQTTNQKEDLIKRKIVEMKTEQDNNNSNSEKKEPTSQCMHIVQSHIRLCM